MTWELIKSRPEQFAMRYTCEVCRRQTQTVIGYNYESDEEALKHVSSHIVNGWWVADDQVVCVFCLGKARDMLGRRRVKGITSSLRQEAAYAFEHEMEFARAHLDELEELIKAHEDEGSPPLRPAEAAFLEDVLRNIKSLRAKVGKDE
jgi:hypothetical protein